LVNTLCDRALRVSYESNKTFVDLESVRQAADDLGQGNEIFWWEWNRQQEMKIKAELEASSSRYNHSPAASDPRNEPAPVDRNPPAYKDEDISQRSVFAIMNELLDKAIGRFSDSPIAQLFVSILLFVASIWFFMVNTRV
jgi:hypothetical protein